MKAGELLGVVLDQEREYAAEAAERLVPVPGDRSPGLLAAFVEADPAPLIEVAVPVSNQDVEQRRDHQRAARMQGAGQVLDDVADRGFPCLGIEVPGGVLVHRSKAPDASVPALEAEALRLLAPTAALRDEPAVEQLQIQDRHLDRRGPKLAPLPAKEEPGEPARLVPRPGRERLGPSRVPDDFL